MSAANPRNWFPTLAVLIGIGVLLLAMVVCNMTCGQGASCTYSELPLGSIVGTRNQLESDNRFPDVNHLATVVGPATDGRIYLVEAQQGLYGNGVQFVALNDFLRRPYTPPLVWIPRDRAFGARVAAIAKSQVGLPYGRLASFGPQRIRGIVPNILGLPRRHNCVSTVRQQVEGASGTALWGFNVPPDMYSLSNFYDRPYLLTQQQPQFAPQSEPVPPNPWKTGGGP